MKKFLAIFLAFTMLLAMLTVPTYAAGEQGATPVSYTPVSIPASTGKTEERNGQTYDVFTYNEKEYLVIRTVAQCLAIDDKDGVANFILANDLDFAGETLSAKGSWSNAEVAVFNGAKEADGKYRLGKFHLEGNGYAMNNVTPPNATASGLFALPVGDNHVISNLTINAPTVTFSANASGVLYGGNNSDTSGATTLAVNNVTINVETFTASANTNHAIFLTKPRVPSTLTDCTLNVTNFNITGGSSQKGIGGFVGLADTAVPVTLTNCKATGNFNSSSSSNAGVGFFVGLVQSNAVELTFKNCTLDANATFVGGKSGGFVGYVKATAIVKFDNCLAKGTYDMHGGQVGVYVGQYESTGALTFTNCHADVAIHSKGDTHGVYLGMSYAQNTVTLGNCTSTGYFVDYANNTGRSWANAFIACVGAGQTVTVNFENCNTDMLLMGYGKAGGYVASTKNGNSGENVKVYFSNCENNATILSGGSASAWFVEAMGGAVVDMTDCIDNTTIIAASNVDYNSLVSENNATVTLYDAASGELAYKLAEAQKAAGVDAKYYFGQAVGTDAQPKVGGATVNAVATTYAGTVYSNTVTGTETVASNAGNAKAYLQTAVVNENTVNSRVIIAVSKAKLAEVADMQIKVTYTLKDATTKTLTLTNHDVDCYYSVYAGDKIAEAEDGFVLLAITVKNIPTTDWDGTSVAVTMTTTDANGDPMPEYTIAA